MKKNNSRSTRINEEVKRELSQIIRNLKDPRINPLTSVVEAQVTKDLKYCKAYISVLGDDESKSDTLKGLNSAVGFIRVELARGINLRNTPEILFVIDDSIEYSIKMSKIMDSINNQESEEEDNE